MESSSATRVVASADDAGLRLDQFLARHLPDLSRSQIQRLIKSGDVRLEAEPASLLKVSVEVTAGLAVRVTIPPAAPATPQAEPLPLAIVYDDADLVVINKAAGLVVHPAPGHATGTLVNALLHHVRGLSGIGGSARPGIVHRLDKGTSGLMVVAKHDISHRHLARQFHDRLVSKEYLALVWGTLESGETIETPIGRDRKHRTKMSTRTEHARSAETRIIDAEPLGGVTLVRVAIGTGRTHQIRVHLSESGHAVAGDEMYGGARKTGPARLAGARHLDRPFLHAARLSFTHPRSGEMMTFEAALPADLQDVLDALRRTTTRTAAATADTDDASEEES